MPIERKTVLSHCRQYRYCLWRTWDTQEQKYAAFIGLNPSTADETVDDPTLRRCVDYGKQWAYGALCMLNLFAYRTPNPKELKAHSDPVGAENDRWLVQVAADASIIIAAWGAHGNHLDRDRTVMSLLRGRLSCLAKTKAGHPKHPLYLRKYIQPIPFA